MRAELFVAIYQLENQVSLSTSAHAHLNPVQYFSVCQSANQYFHSVT